MAAHASSEYHKSLGYDGFLTPWLPVKDWNLLKEEWNRAEGFSVGIHAGTVEDRRTLLVMLKRWCKQVNVYEGFDMQELTGFALARGLDSDGKFSAVSKMPQIS
ncbi:hypothetical protein D6D01_03533 [Aureobasidium pullulans]|uniref:Uncharacterized protein n=1 Tax=Aureobasidium pullulans TaxID=5580 RepID=A0A4S9LIV1_AURPU|nr:hypothetical protein D6D01_03533 [Aureobasidium pullulans]